MNTAANPPITTEAEMESPVTNGHFKLLQAALRSAHSASFYEDVEDAAIEAQANFPSSISGWLCAAAILGLLISVPALAACVTGFACVLAIAGHYLAIAGVACSCSDACS